jgi:hypothetical protein
MTLVSKTQRKEKEESEQIGSKRPSESIQKLSVMPSVIFLFFCRRSAGTTET